TPFANLRGDLISVNDSYNGVDTAILDDQSRARGYVAAGLTAEYPWLARTTSASHVVSPIGQVIARTGSNADDQAELPNEDARSLVFDDTNLFEVDKFSGFDRIETGSRANVGLQYTFQADNGGHARILAGLSFRLDDENPFERPGQIPVAPADPTGGIQTEPTFNEDNGLDTRRSDVVVGAYLSPNSMFQVISQARFDEDGFGLRQADIFARVAYGPIFASGSYAFTSNEFARENLQSECFLNGSPVLDSNGNPVCDDQQELIANIGVRLSEFWTLSAGTRYDIDSDFRLQDTVGLKYADECFVLAVSYTETRIEDESRDLEPDRTIMVRFDLKHIGQFQTNTSINSLLEADSTE
ncbi:MAG: LPS assembly protein LptD, partial [Pseudomonadota bacterium]